MSDEPSANDGSQRISVQDAIRLKHSLNKSIPWGTSNLNAREVEELTRLDAKNYAAIRSDYAEWHSGKLKNYALLGVIIGCIIAYLLSPYGWVRIAAVAIGIICYYIISKREGHAEGYVEGYEAGYEAGIYKALGIRNEQVGEMAKKATEMKIDDMLVERMDEPERQPDETGSDQSKGL